MSEQAEGRVDGADAPPVETAPTEVPKETLVNLPLNREGTLELKVAKRELHRLGMKIHKLRLRLRDERKRREDEGVELRDAIQDLVDELYLAGGVDEMVPIEGGGEALGYYVGTEPYLVSPSILEEFPPDDVEDKDEWDHSMVTDEGPSAKEPADITKEWDRERAILPEVKRAVGVTVTKRG